MTVLSQLYQRYQNTTISSFDANPANDGQCVQWALMVRTQRDDLPKRLGNAVDWWINRGTDIRYYDYIPYVIGTYPKAGDYVVWGNGVGSAAGHIDLCATDGDASGFTGYDSNWQDKPTLTTIRHNYLLGILGYIRIKEQGMNTPAVNEGDIANMWHVGGMPGDPDPKYVANWVGSDWKKFMYDITAQGIWQKNFNDKIAQLSDANGAGVKINQIKEIVNS